jgi:hypothetical protein
MRPANVTLEGPLGRAFSPDIKAANSEQPHGSYDEPSTMESRCLVSCHDP